MAMESATRRQFVSGVAALGAAGVLASGAGVALAEEAASSEADAGEASGEVAASEDGVPAGGTARWAPAWASTATSTLRS